MKHILILLTAVWLALSGLYAQTVSPGSLTGNAPQVDIVTNLTLSLSYQSGATKIAIVKANPSLSDPWGFNANNSIPFNNNNVVFSTTISASSTSYDITLQGGNVYAWTVRENGVWHPARYFSYRYNKPVISAPANNAQIASNSVTVTVDAVDNLPHQYYTGGYIFKLSTSSTYDTYTGPTNVYASTSSATPSATFNNLPVGNYALFVQAYNEKTASKYALSTFSVVTAQPTPCADNAYEPNENTSEASTTFNVLGSSNSTQTKNAKISSTTDNDYFRLDVTASGSISIGLSNLPADYDLKLLNSAGSVIESSALSGTNSETISTSLTSGIYYVRVLGYNGAFNCANNYALEVNWTPASVTPTETIAITYPNGGQALLQGEFINMSWTSNFSGNVTIQIVPNGSTVAVLTLQDNYTNTGALGFTIPNTLNGEYKVKIYKTATNSPVDYSDAFFTISPPTSNTPTLTVASPNGGETFNTGSVMPITWTSQNFSGNVSLQLVQASNNTVLATIADGISNSGSYNWTIPTMADNTVKIKLYGTNGGTPLDYSNNSFTINTPTPPPVPTYTVSGKVSLANGTGVLALISTGVSTVATNILGNYSTGFQAGTDVVLTPTSNGYTFSPASITINDIQANHTQQNFVATPVPAVLPCPTFEATPKYMNLTDDIIFQAHGLPTNVRFYAYVSIKNAERVFEGFLSTQAVRFVDNKWIFRPSEVIKNQNGHNGQLQPAKYLYRIIPMHADATVAPANTTCQPAQEMSIVNKIWHIPFQHQTEFRNWVSACGPTTVASLINYLYSQGFDSQGREITKDIMNGYKTTGQRLYANGTQLGNDIDTDLADYLENYPKNGIKQYTTANCQGFGPESNETMQEYDLCSNGREASETNTNNYTGTHWQRIEAVFRRYGINFGTRRVNVTEAVLREMVDNGPVLLSSKGHIILVVGRDANGFICHDPWGDRTLFCHVADDNGEYVSYDFAYLTATRLCTYNTTGIAYAYSFDTRLNSDARYNSLCDNDLKFDRNPAGDVSVTYNGDGPYRDFFRGFSYTGNDWNYVYELGNAYMYAPTNAQATNRASFSMPIIKTGHYQLAAFIPERANRSRAVTYSIFIDNNASSPTPTHTVTINQATATNWTNLLNTRVYAQEGQTIRVEVTNQANQANLNRVVVADMMRCLYGATANAHMQVARVNSTVQNIGSIVSGSDIHFREKDAPEWEYFGRANESGMASGLLPEGECELRIVAAGYDTTFVRKEVNMTRVLAPMYEANDFETTNKIINPAIEAEGIVFTLPTTMLKLKAKNALAYQIYRNRVDLGVINNGNYACPLDTGANVIKVRFMGIADTAEVEKTLYYYPQKQVQTPNPYALDGSTYPDITYRTVVLNVETKYAGATLLGGQGEKIKILSAGVDTILVPTGHEGLSVLQFGYALKELFINKDTTITLSLTERKAFEYSQVHTTSKGFAGLGTNLKTISVKENSYRRYVENLDYVGLKPVGEVFEVATQETQTVQLKTLVDLANVPQNDLLMLGVQRGGIWQKYLKGSFAYDSLFKKLTVEGLTLVSGINRIALLQAQAPIALSPLLHLVNYEVPTQLLDYSDSLAVELSRFFGRPDSLGSDMLIELIRFDNTKIDVRVVGKYLIIRRINGTGSGVVKFTLRAVYDGLQTEKEFELTGVTNVEDNILSKFGIVLYPNPISKEVDAQIKYFDTVTHLEGTLHDATGNTLKEYTNLKNQPLDLKKLPTGMYFFNLKINRKYYVTLKFIIQ